MPYEHKIEKHADYLRVEVHGEREKDKEVEDSLAGWKLVTETCRRENIKKILVVLNLTGPFSVLSAYQITQLAEGINFDRQFKAAIVDLNRDSIDSNRFGEVAATNRGYTIKTFDNEDEAIAWLRR